MGVIESAPFQKSRATATVASAKPSLPAQRLVDGN